jgi:hypothetical protein
MCLVFRVGDMRDDSFIVGNQISAKIVRRKCTAEGENENIDLYISSIAFKIKYIL